MSTNFPQTTTTLVERLSRGGKEGWSAFWKKYEKSIKEVLENVIRKYRGQLDYDDPNAYILAVFQRIQKKFNTYVHHGGTKFRWCIITWISNAIYDELVSSKNLVWQHTDLKPDDTDLKPDENDDNGHDLSRIDKFSDEIRHVLWVELQKASLRYAANRFPWRGARKEIVKLLATLTLTDGEIAQRCNTDPSNVSKVKAALVEKAKVYLNEFKSDDSAFSMNWKGDTVCPDLALRTSRDSLRLSLHR